MHNQYTNLPEYSIVKGPIMQENHIKVKIALLGFGREGKSTLQFLLKSPIHKGAEIWILDKNLISKSHYSDIPKSVHIKTGRNYTTNLSSFDLIFRSPGIPYLLPALQDVRKKGVVITSQTKLFFALMRPMRKKLIGITGTKGKGTTVTLLAHILKNAKKRVTVVGNIGFPMLDALRAARRADFVILELSSFQLQDLTESPHIATVIDMFPDHLDSHASLREYYDAKTAIAKYQIKGDSIFYLAENPISTKIAKQSRGKKFPVYPHEKGSRKNRDIAIAIAKHIGVSDTIIQKSLKNFRGLAHRMELVRTITTEQGIIDFFDDSAATNPEAAGAAITSFTHPFILIAGGKNKNLDYAPLRNAAIKQKQYALEIIAIGEIQHKLSNLLGPLFFKKYSAPTISSAVLHAYRTAKQSLSEECPRVSIILSPGAASFDMFKNYEDRGMQYKKAVQAQRA
ncbi:MAG: UDP-N-acetylmuramoyl-L-alanine--D-glutamate ligase [Patescibacteria group bacterium]